MVIANALVHRPGGDFDDKGLDFSTKAILSEHVSRLVVSPSIEIAAADTTSLKPGART
jgi:hypothetical protein